MIWLQGDLIKVLVILEQGFSKSTFKGPNLNFHQCQRSGMELLVITKLVFHKHTVAYLTCITNKHPFKKKYIKCPLHSKYINKCKSGKTMNLRVCNRCRPIPIRVFLWPMPIFRNQGSRWPILNADFFGRFSFFPLSHKRV